MWLQEEVTLKARSRGFHLVTDEVLDAVPGLEGMRVGVAHIFIRHTSASLTLNENADSKVLRDFRAWIDRAVPEDADYWTHGRDEGSEDMPAHVKTALLGTSLTLPVADGRLALGTWQGIYLCEHRDGGGERKLLVTAWGEGD